MGAQTPGDGAVWEHGCGACRGGPRALPELSQAGQGGLGTKPRPCPPSLEKASQKPGAHPHAIPFSPPFVWVNPSSSTLWDARWGRAAGGRAPGTPQGTGLHLGPVRPSVVLQAKLRQGLAPWISQSPVRSGRQRPQYLQAWGWGRTGTIGAATLLAVQGTTAGRCSAWVSPGMWS